MDKPVLRLTGKWLATLLLAVIFLWALPPFFRGIQSIGSFVPLIFSAGTLLFLWNRPLREKIRGRRWSRNLWRIALVLYFAGISCFGVLLCMLLGAGTNRPGEEDRTVVVLGCQVRGETPSLMLEKRLQVAYAYLEAHPDAPCVVSGGQGPGEDISEAEAMYRWLVERGIEPGRIYLESASTSTAENLRYSAAVIREEGLPISGGGAATRRKTIFQPPPCRLKRPGTYWNAITSERCWPRPRPSCWDRGWKTCRC